ncbi:MAG: hypothetical protein IPJ54_02995 [Saprospiraceae bacterium]|nr:hypothetical protein [Saprospiraceae bacterium]
MKYCVLFLLALLSLPFYAQTLDPGEYLKSYKDHAGYISFDQYDQGVGALRFGLPVVDELNVRTETDQFNLSRQEYALRVMFNGWGAGSAYAKEKTWLQQKIQSSQQRYASDLLLQRYEDLCELYFFEQHLPVYLADSLLADSMVLLVVKNMLADEENNLGDVINWENKKTESARKLNELRYAIEIQKSKMKIGGAVFSWAHWPHPEFMLKTLNDLSPKKMSDLDDKDFEADSSLISYRWQTSKSNDHKILDFAQLRYSKRDNLLFQDEFSIGVGLRLPYKGTQKRQSNEFRLDLLKIQQERVLQQEEKINAFTNELHRFLLIYNQWKVLVEQKPGISLLNEKNAAVERALYVERKKREIERWSRRLELEKKLTLQYLRTLYMAGVMENTVNTNYLSSLLPSF